MSDKHQLLRKIVAALPGAAGLFAGALGIAVLIGWQLEIEQLKRVLPGLVTMKANTAIGFVLAGAALIVASRDQQQAAMPVRWLLEILVLLTGGLTLLQYLAAVDLGIDQLFFTEVGDATLTSAPGRMSPATAVNFVLCASALVSDHWRTAVGRTATRTLAVLMIIVSLAALFGYVLGAPILYLAVQDFTAMALHTAVAFIAIGLGLMLIHPEFGLPALLVEDSLPGMQLRSLLPAVLALPLLIGAVVLAGLDTLYGAETAVALAALTSTVATGVLVAVSTVILLRAEGALHLRDRALASATSGIIITDHTKLDEPIQYTNRAFVDITGYSYKEIVGQNCRFLNKNVEGQEKYLNTIREAIAKGHECTVIFQNARKDGTLFWNRLSLAPVHDYMGRTTNFVGVIDDVSQEKAYEERLEEALTQVEAAHKERDAFVSVITHELRSPMNSAMTWVGLLEVDPSDENVKSGIRIIKQSIESQKRLLDDLVDITRASAGRLTLEMENVLLSDLLHLTVEELRPQAEDKQLKLNYEADESDYTISADPVRFQQIFRNLFNNAIKYTSEGGAIRVRLTKDDGYAQIAVDDTGKGLSTDQLENIFEPFWRGTNQAPGLGIGLAIVKALVEGHGGSITVSSEGVGHGARFVVRLPLAAGSEASSARVPSNEGASEFL